MNRFYEFRDGASDIFCRLFNINKEVLSKVEGVMFNYSTSTVELRDKNYATVASLTTGMPLQDTFNYVAFEHEVIGIRSFHKFLKTIGTATEQLEWLEVWSDGLIKTSYHMHLNFNEEPDNIIKY